MFPPKVNNQEQRPWNKGRLVGQKPPLKLKEIWEIRIRLQIDESTETWRFSIWPSTASYAPAISSNFACPIFRKEIGSLLVQL